MVWKADHSMPVLKKDNCKKISSRKSVHFTLLLNLLYRVCIGLDDVSLCTRNGCATSVSSKAR